ncbi:MAG TPA: DUF4142 domain-containing protein [Kofleriaceae bacterium]|nr:DUF4142 domain-containing protein [Kofleriaceae bacterium]
MTIQTLAGAALFAALIAPAASADPGRAKLVDAELQTLAHIHRVNQLEIEMGRLAEKKGTTPGIKAYGGMIVRDHTANDRDALALAKRHGQAIPKEIATNESDRAQMKDDDEMVDKLKSENGADFDRDFLAAAVTGHERELARSDTAIGQAQAVDLQTFLKDMKPVLQHHLDAARDLQKANAQAATP